MVVEPKTAVIACAPAVKEDVLREAEPLDRFTNPIGTPPSWNCTAPVAALGEIAAVNVTDVPTVAGFTEDDSAMDVVAKINSETALVVLEL